MQSITIDELSKSLKIGDSICTYEKGWWALFSHIIILYQGGKPSHVMKVIDVRRDDKGLVTKFEVIESKSVFGVVSSWHDINNPKPKSFLSRVYKGKKDLFLNSLKAPLNNTQITNLQVTAVGCEGQVYGISNVIKSIIFRPLLRVLSRLLGLKKFQYIKPNPMKQPLSCASFVHYLDLDCEIADYIKYIVKPYITPREYMFGDKYTTYRVKL
jgi:hypothetical protein